MGLAARAGEEQIFRLWLMRQLQWLDPPGLKGTRCLKGWNSRQRQRQRGLRRLYRHLQIGAHYRSAMGRECPGLGALVLLALGLWVPQCYGTMFNPCTNITAVGRVRCGNSEPRRICTQKALAACWLLLCASCIGLSCSSVLQGDAFPVGLALIPGANATALSTALGLLVNFGGLCNSTFRDLLVRCCHCMLLALYTALHCTTLHLLCPCCAQVNQFGAQIAVFNVKVDRLSVLRMPYTDIIFPLINATTNHNLQALMTAVLFRCVV